MKQTLKFILSVVNDNLKYSENKHSILAAFSGAIIVFCATKIEDKYNISVLFSTISILLCSISIFICFLALLSRNVSTKHSNKLKHNQKKDNNLLYFKNICDYGVEDYLKQIQTDYKLPKDYRFDDFDRDLASSIIATSKLTNLKLKFYNLSLFYLIFGICFIISSFVSILILP